MTNSQLHLAIGWQCLQIGLVSLLALAGQVSARKQNVTDDYPWAWVDLPNTVVTGDLALRPGQDSKSWRHDGWVSYGKKASRDECRQACAADKDCWAFTSYEWEGKWLGYCYGRAPNTRRVLPAVFESEGYFSAYKSFAGKTFPNDFAYGYDLDQTWTVPTTFEKQPNVNLFAGGFCSPTTKSQSEIYGELTVGYYAAASSFAYPAIARGGAVNIGEVFNENMCIAAADYSIYLDLVGASPSIVGLYYTWYTAADDFAHLCVIGSQPFGSKDTPGATSGKRLGTPSEGITVEPTDDDN